MASEWKRFLEEEGYEKFKEAMRLSDEDSKDDPEDDPFRSKYRSREILLEVKEKLKPHLEKFREQDQELVFLDCVIDLRLGVNYIDTEELHSGEEYLVKVIECTEKYKLDKNAADIYLHALNNLGILWFGRRNPEKALSYLLKAEELYFQYKKEVDGPPKFVAEYLKSAEDEKEKLEHLRNANFENSYTHTLYYMAQVYAKLDESEKSALCCHKTLQRQLDAHKYTPLDWAINAATLSQYFVTKDEYPQARHCLACAEVIFEEIQFSENENVSEDEKEKVQQGKADIQRCWAKYGLALLEFSKDRLLKATEEDTPLDPDESEKEFEKFNLEVTSREEQITCKPVRDFEEARNVFLRVQTWISGAKEFYVFDGRCTDYIELVQDHSKAFKLLAFFELNLDRQCKMHKRRSDMLLEVCNELNPQHYLLIVRQLIYELAEIYSGIMDIKYMILKEEGGQPSIHAIKKINSLALQSIQKYQAYIDSFKDNKPDLPDEYPELDTRPILVAWFCMGRLYSKILPLNVRERLDNIKKTEACYQYIIDYCKRHHKAAECMRAELEVCEEMVALLPVKMEKIRQEADI